MPSGVNHESAGRTRAYDSSRRRAQAANSRRGILAAAQRLFSEQGYAATTMAEIARAAGVSLKTVYLAFETKGGLIRALWDLALRGEPDIAVAEQPWYRAVLDEPDPERKLRITAANSRAVKARIGGVLAVIRGSAPADPDLAALWSLIQADFHANQRVIVQQLYDAGALRPDLTVEQATDILWTLNHPDVWLLLVGARGWTPEEWETWFGDSACGQLLKKS
ncbi:MAG: TetR/AcrR family transcriptional regulator [Actinomycetales bacterium]